jgi:Flp pilus assembly protein TadD
MPRCKNCNTELKISDAFCKDCGTKVAKEGTDVFMIECANPACRKKLSGGSAFCDVCGTRVPPKEVGEQPQIHETPRKRKKGGNWIAVLIVIVFITAVTTPSTCRYLAERIFEEGSELNLKGHYYSAIEKYDWAIRLNSKEAKYYNHRGVAYFYNNNYDLAIHDFDSAIDLDPYNAQFYGNRCDAYLHKTDYKKAIADCSEAIRLDPNVASFHNDKGIARYHAKDYTGAIMDFTNVIRLDPGNAGYRRNRGLSYDAKNDYAEAVEDYKEAIRLNSDDDASKKRLAELEELRCKKCGKWH